MSEKQFSLGPYIISTLSHSWAVYFHGKNDEIALLTLRIAHLHLNNTLISPTVSCR